MSAGERKGVPAVLTELNGRHLPQLARGGEAASRLSGSGAQASALLQPKDFVKELTGVFKARKLGREFQFPS